jgi:hypothetical protein
MLGERTLRVVFVRSGHGVGVDATERPDASVTYKGAAVTVKARP